LQRIAPLALTSLLAMSCQHATPPDDGVAIGLMLSYSGYLAASSINSERALLLAIESVNAGGGLHGPDGAHPLRVEARDTRSDPSKVAEPARELLDHGVALMIGPDTTDLVTQLRAELKSRTVILPSFTTASDVEFKPPAWFVIGAGISRVACELVTQVRKDGRQKPLVIVNPSGYNSSIAWVLGNTYGMPKTVLAADHSSSRESVRPITAQEADAYVLAAFPSSASSLINALAATGALTDPSRWYLSPTLHTPAFLESISRGALAGARGVAPGTLAGAAEFRARFTDRWQDVPLDDAYPFFDAGAIAALALQRALTQEGAVPADTGLAKHVLAVTHPGGTPVHWDELAQGLDLVRQGKDIEYIGLSGLIEFDASGQTSRSATSWWSIGPDGFVDVAHESNCQ
jgi:branched-chain amino acid transport system substrate-binding protein